MDTLIIYKNGLHIKLGPATKSWSSWTSYLLSFMVLQVTGSGLSWTSFTTKTSFTSRWWSIFNKYVLGKDCLHLS